jgi:hypothetical protein
MKLFMKLFMKNFITSWNDFYQGGMESEEKKIV